MKTEDSVVIKPVALPSSSITYSTTTGRPVSMDEVVFSIKCGNMLLFIYVAYIYV